MTIRTYDNPQISGLDFGMGGQVVLDGLLIDTVPDTSADTDSISQPTHTTFGIRTVMAGVGIGASDYKNLHVFGYYIGIYVAETFRATWFCVARCWYAMYTQPTVSFHPIWGSGQLSECVYSICVTGRASFDMSLDFQPRQAGSGPWWCAAPGSDIYDPGNYATGIIKYSKLFAYVGSPVMISTTGCERLNLLSLDGLETRLAGNVLRITSPIEFTGSLNVQNDLNVRGNLTLFDGAVRTVGFGPDDSAVPGYRALEVPNVGAIGERSTLATGVEAPLTGTLTTGLVSDWNCNDAATAGAVDNSPGSNDLTSGGTTTSQTGRINQAIGFNGSNQYLAITNAAQIGLDRGNSDYTISCWVYLQSKTVDQTILAKGSGVTHPDAYALQYSASGDKYVWVIQYNGTAYASLPLASFGSPPLNTWTFICVWYEYATNKMYGQVNNGPVDTVTVGGVPDTTSGDFTVGCFGTSTGRTQYLNGRVDAIGFWSRLLTP